MQLLTAIKNSILQTIQHEFSIPKEILENVDIAINVDKAPEFGDLNCNVAMVITKHLKQQPRVIAESIKTSLLKKEIFSQNVSSIEIAGAGFINIFLKKEAWITISKELFINKKNNFVLDKTEPVKKYLIEFVSANPTGPLHLGHGRGGIIGDVLANVLTFLGHKADKEFYINDAGTQIAMIGESLKIRCLQQLGKEAELPENGYAGDYVIELAKECIAHYGEKVEKQDAFFFQEFAKERLLAQIKQTLDEYGIKFDRWYSEKQLHTSGAIEKVITLLQDKKLVYEKDEALWFSSTQFGDDKDRVIKKSDGNYTYIAADIAYHKEKFERGYQKLINVLGQDHHGYVMRLKATMQALGYNDNDLDVILYQLVTLKRSGEQIRMSKRTGTFEELQDVIEQVGRDVARFFYLNRKADAHLEFDLDVALKKTEENPVYYIQYAYVRINSLFAKAEEILKGKIDIDEISDAEIIIIKKICSLHSLLRSISKNYQTHLLSYYTLELAQVFHNYYAKYKIIDSENLKTTKNRLFIVTLLQQTISTCLDLLGISKPERM